MDPPLINSSDIKIDAIESVFDVTLCLQINALLWSSRCRELVSAHGGSGKAVCLWRWPSFDQVGRLARHDASVLGLALSPDGATLGGSQRPFQIPEMADPSFVQLLAVLEIT